MLAEEVTQGVEQCRSVFYLAGIQRLVNVIDYHTTDLLAAMRLIEQALRHRRSSDFGDVFMFADGRDFLLTEATQTDAILQRDQGAPRRRRRFTRPISSAEIPE